MGHIKWFRRCLGGKIWLPSHAFFIEQLQMQSCERYSPKKSLFSALAELLLFFLKKYYTTGETSSNHVWDYISHNALFVPSCASTLSRGSSIKKILSKAALRAFAKGLNCDYHCLADPDIPRRPFDSSLRHLVRVPRLRPSQCCGPILQGSRFRPQHDQGPWPLTSACPRSPAIFQRSSVHEFQEKKGSKSL